MQVTEGPGQPWPETCPRADLGAGRSQDQGRKGRLGSGAALLLVRQSLVVSGKECQSFLLSLHFQLDPHFFFISYASSGVSPST